MCLTSSKETTVTSIIFVFKGQCDTEILEEDEWEEPWCNFTVEPNSVESIFLQNELLIAIVELFLTQQSASFISDLTMELLLALMQKILVFVNNAVRSSILDEIIKDFSVQLYQARKYLEANRDDFHIHVV